MSAYEQFEGTHQVLAHDDNRVVTCKSALISALKATATEFRVGIHTTEHEKLTSNVASLAVLTDPQLMLSEEEMTWRVGKLPDDEAALQSIHTALGDDGGLPVSVLSFHGATFDGLVTASTSHSHVGKLNIQAPSSPTEPSENDFIVDLNDSLDNHGLVVPVDIIAAWEQGGKYFELSGPQLCVYAAPVAELSEEERLSVTHHCHDLTALQSIAASLDSNEIELSWESSDSIVVRVAQKVFGSPPTRLVVPQEGFSEIRSHLLRFVE